MSTSGLSADGDSVTYRIDDGTLYSIGATAPSKGVLFIDARTAGKEEFGRLLERMKRGLKSIFFAFETREVGLGANEYQLRGFTKSVNWVTGECGAKNK